MVHLPTSCSRRLRKRIRVQGSVSILGASYAKNSLLVAVLAQDCPELQPRQLVLRRPDHKSRFLSLVLFVYHLDQLNQTRPCPRCYQQLYASSPLVYKSIELEYQSLPLAQGPLPGGISKSRYPGVEQSRGVLLNK